MVEKQKILQTTVLLQSDKNIPTIILQNVVSYGGIAQWCTNLSPEASGELYPHVTVQKQ